MFKRAELMKHTVLEITELLSTNVVPNITVPYSAYFYIHTCKSAILAEVKTVHQ